MKTINSLRSKLFALTLALMASVSTFAQAPDFKVGELYYKVLEGNTVEVTYRQRPVSPTGDSTATPKKNSEGLGYENFIEVVIPSMITYEDKTYHVTRIGHGTFWLCDKLTYVDIPNTIKSIGIAAFRSCRTLASITLNEGLESIEHHAFYDCVRLKEVTLPSTLKTMGQSMFAFSTDLEKVTSKAIVPPTVEKDVLTDTDNYNAAIIANATLYVPAQSLITYQNTYPWNTFGHILPIESTIDYKSQWCDTWNVMEHDMGMTSDTEKTWRHYLANDTIINGQTYTSVNCYWTLEESKVYKIAHVRFSEDKKVYALMDDTEYLVYDFSVQVGDTIETIVGAFSGSMLQQLLVHQIDIDGATNRKTITLYPICRIEDDEYDEDWVYLWDCCPVQWIEGVGSTDGFLMGYPPCGYVGGIGHKLLCAYKDDELQYINDLYQDDYGCEYNAVEQNPEDLFPTLWGLQRTSCDEWYDGCGENKSYLFAPKEVKEINGKLYLKCGGVFLREEDSKVLIYSFPYEKDLVLYDYTLEVGDTLQNLGIDIYSFPELEYAAVVDYIAYEDYDVETDEFIIKKEPLGSKRVQEVSTITLLDGKEYKRWLFGNDWENGNYYVEGIGNVGGSFGGDYIDIANPYGIPTCYLGERLVCVSKNNKLLYQMDDAEMERLGAECLCDYDRGPRKDNAKNGKIGGRPTPTQWNMLEVETKEMDGTPTILRAETFSYTLENDSIVAKGKTFYQLARQSTKDTAITKSFVGALHFGEDEDNRVYFLRDGVEYVLYDFTAEPGDTIEIFAGINNYPQETTYTHVVVDKDTTEDGACRMFLEVVFPDETTTATNAEKVWLAGLGSIDGIVHNAAQRTSDVHAAPARSASSETQTSVMLCAWREDSCLYTTNHPEYDTFGCVYNQDPTAVEDVQTSGDKYQKIIRDGHLYILRDNKLYDVLGTPMN